jgi:hypothetical protein
VVPEGREKVTMMGDEEFMRDLYDLLHLFGDKLVSPIVVTLAEGPMRRVEISFHDSLVFCRAGVVG